MRRADVLQYLQSAFSSIATELNVEQEDTSAGYRFVLDSTERAVVLDSTAPDAVYAAASYFALRFLRRRAATQVDVTTQGDEPVAMKRAQLVAHLTALLAEAKAETEGYGVVLTEHGSGGQAILSLGWLASAPVVGSAW
jgi:hypothetical protein